MAVDVSKIPNNNKFDPVREAILQLQTDIEDTGNTIGNGTLTIGTSGSLSGSGTFTANQSGNSSITIGIDDSDYLSLSDTGEQTISGDIIISGDLTVSGATITKLSEEVLIEDNIIVLNSNEDGTPSLDAGIEIERGTATNVDFLWNETDNRWDLKSSGSGAGLKVYNDGIGSTTLTISAGGTAGDAVIALTPNTGTGGVIKTTNAKDIAFQPNSTTKMVIASGGDVNIYDSLAVGKTGAPSYALDVTGDGYFGRSSASQTSVLTIEQLNNIGSSQNLLIKTAYDRDVGIKLETGGGSHYIWQDSNGDDSLIISSVDTASSSITMEFYQNHNVEIPNGELTVSGNINGNLVGNVTGGTISGTSATFSGGLGVSGGVTIENADGSNVGHIQLGTVDNDAGNNYVRGNILFGRDVDQVTWDSANDEWTYLAGGSSDFSLILHDSAAFRILTGDGISTTTTYTNQEFRDAFQALTINQSGDVSIFKGDLKIGSNTVIDSSRNVFANDVTANEVSATSADFEDVFLTNASGASLSFRNSQGNTVDTDNLATISFQGLYDSAYVGASRIQVKANEDFSATARGSVINFDFWDTGSTYDTVASIDADGFYIGTTNVYDNLPDGITYSDTDNKLKIGVSKNVGSTTETNIQPILLANVLNEGYIPYVDTGDGGSITGGVNSKVSDSWLKVTSDTLELGDSDPVSHEVRYARFLWQSGSNDKISTVYGARDITASVQYSGGSATAKIAFTTGTGAGRIRFNDAFSFPVSDGTSGQVLTTDGSGSLSWAAAGGSLDLQDVTDNGATTTNSVYFNGDQKGLRFGTTSTVYGSVYWDATLDGVIMQQTQGTDWTRLKVGDASTGNYKLELLSGASVDAGEFTSANWDSLFTIDSNGNVNVVSGAIQIDGTTVIDSSRNITGVLGTFTDTVSITKNGIALDIENSQSSGNDTGIRIRGARNGQTYATDNLTSYILFSNYDDNTTPNNYDLAKIGAGMYDAGDDTGFFQIQVNDGTSLVKALDIEKNKDATFYGSVTATSLIKDGGTSSQFLKADGSVDSNTYLTSYTETDTLDSVTDRGATTTNSITVGGLTVDTNTLYVDATNNRVGIGTISPSSSLEVFGDTNSGAYGSYPAITLRNNNASGYSVLHFNQGATQKARVEVSNTNGSMGLYTTSGTNGIHIQSDGKVGVGTTGPSYKLDVNGSARFGSYITLSTGGAIPSAALSYYTNGYIYLKGGGGGVAVLDDSGASGLYVNDDLSANINVNNSAALKILSNGNVGIGTTSPAEKLSVNGAIRTTGVTTSNESSATIAWNNTPNEASFESRGKDNTARGGIVLYQAYANGTNGLRALEINSSGNVGIGVTPAAWATAGNTKALQISTRGAISEAYDNVFLSNNYYFDGSERYIETNVASRLGCDPTGNIIFQNAPSGTAGSVITFEERMRIDSSGNVGIGTTSPAYTLDVTGGGRFTTNLRVGQYIYHDGDTNTSIRFLGDRIILYAGGVNMIDVTEGGTDYIDFANNTARITSGGAFETTGDIIAYTTTSLSDKNQKENIKKIDSPIEKIKQISGYTFDWKHNQASSGGVIAQEVEKVLPEIVKEKSIMDSEPHKTVEYNGLIGLLIETVKEQQKQIDELKARLDGSTK